MASPQNLIAQIDELFNSRSIAVVGVPRGLKTGLSFFPGVSKDPGPVGMISHSGSLTNILGTIAATKGIRFSKVISSGNDSDLTPETNQIYVDGMIQVHQECQKPILAVTIPGFDPKYSQQLCRGGIPFFDSAERAVHTYALAVQYKNWLNKRT